MKQPEAILDFGTSKIACLVANCSGDGSFEVFGVGVSEYRGIKKSRFLDEPGLLNAIKGAVEAAQSEANRRIKEVYVGAPGSFVEIVCSQAEIDLGKARDITHADLDTLIEASYDAIDYLDPNEYVYTQSMPMYFRVDDNLRREAPIGQPGQRLWGAVAHVFVQKDFVSIVEELLDELGIAPISFIYSTYAEGMMIVPSERMLDDTVIIDAGYHETDICILRNGVPVYKNTLPIGGIHFANDIYYVLQIAPEVAETIKRRHVFGLDYTDRTDTFRTVSGRMEDFEYEEIQDIIEARAEEFADLLVDTIENAPVKIRQDTDIYVCGGGFAMMRGSREFLQAQTGYSIKYSIPWLPRNNSANYISIYGILKFLFSSGLQKESITSGFKNSAMVRALVNFFTK